MKIQKMNIFKKILVLLAFMSCCFCQDWLEDEIVECGGFNSFEITRIISFSPIISDRFCVKIPCFDERIQNLNVQYPQFASQENGFFYHIVKEVIHKQDFLECKAVLASNFQNESITPCTLKESATVIPEIVGYDIMKSEENGKIFPVQIRTNQLLDYRRNTQNTLILHGYTISGRGGDQTKLVFYSLTPEALVVFQENPQAIKEAFERIEFGELIGLTSPPYPTSLDQEPPVPISEILKDDMLLDPPSQGAIIRLNHGRSNECFDPFFNPLFEPVNDCEGVKFHGKCLDQCPGSDYTNQNGTCQRKNCLCNYDNIQGTCETCIEGAFMYQGNCFLVCPQGTPNMSTGTCDVSGDN